MDQNRSTPTLTDRKINYEKQKNKLEEQTGSVTFSVADAAPVSAVSNTPKIFGS